MLKKMKELPPEKKRRMQKEFGGYERARKWVLNRYGNYSKESLSSNSDFSGKSVFTSDVRDHSPLEAGSPPPASLSKEKTCMRGEK